MIKRFLDSDRGNMIVFCSLQTLNVVAALANAALAVWNFTRGNYASAALSGTVTAVLVITLVRSQRKYLQMKREDREWLQSWADFDVDARLRELFPLDSRFRAPVGATAEELLKYARLQELEQCRQSRVCPDCGTGLLDDDDACLSPQCGSKFTVVDGKWSRRE